MVSSEIIGLIERERGRRDPTVRSVDLLKERVAGLLAVHPQRGVITPVAKCTEFSRVIVIVTWSGTPSPFLPSPAA